ncbi:MULTISPECIES: hypothetical protein [Streptomyces]|uniref:hypothetical protein n=1 Tax=Streptomyces TaxID=1883 RepID=UPI00058D1FF3|nr:hypothetical protein [Streptomyces sp. SCSIO ZS0520]
MAGSQAGSGAVEWLLSAAPDPEGCERSWEEDPHGVVLLPAGALWDVLLVPGALGRAALDVLLRCTDRPGPVLAGIGDARLGFFVPPGTSGRWFGEGIRGAGAGTWIAVPHPERLGTGMRWLILPDGEGTLTDPPLLELALREAADLTGT